MVKGREKIWMGMQTVFTYFKAISSKTGKTHS